MLSGFPGERVHLLVVWEPVLASDVGPPADGVMALVGDARARQLWDPDHLVSAELLRAGSALRESSALHGRDVVWDWVAVFPRDARWAADPPKPGWAGGDVVSVISDAQVQLRAALAKP